MAQYVLRRWDMAPGDTSSLPVRWWAFFLLGALSVVVGVLLVLDLAAAATSLALLVAFGLLFTGLGELVGSGRYRTTWSTVSGLILIVAGIVAAAWPDITVWVLAIITATGLLLSGTLRVVAAATDRPDGWGWLLIGGLLSLAVGVMALAWPAATVLVLGLMLGIWLVIFGASEVAFALALRDLQKRMS